MTVTVHQNPKLLDYIDVASRITDSERDQWEAFTGQAYDVDSVAIAAFTWAGPKWSLHLGDRPLAVGGFLPVSRGVWQEWMISTDECWSDANWKQATRHCRAAFDAMLKTEAHRLQCVSLASRIQVHKWYRLLGLQFEHRIHAYGADGEDALVFYRLRKEE